MRKPLIIMMIALLVLSCKNEQPQRTLPPNTYEINVTAKGTYNGLRAYVYVMNERRQEIGIDTAMIVNEQAQFTGKVQGPVMRQLKINGVQGFINFVLEPGIIDIEIYKDSIGSSVIKGGKVNDGHNAYKKLYKKRSDEILAMRDELTKARQQSDTARYGELYQKSLEMQKNLSSVPFEFIESNPDDDFSLLLLETTLLGVNQDLDKIKSAVASLKDVIDKNPSNQLIGRKVQTWVAQKEAVANLEIGKIAPNFSAPDPDGKEISLNDIRGKATIIDFWASWCGPCRRENPNVVRVYEKYHDKGLEIISVSLDRPNQKDRWLQAIEKDKLTWYHVSNLKYFNEPVARLYNVSSIPSTFILDEEGKIVAKKLRGKALEDQIASMLN